MYLTKKVFLLIYITGSQPFFRKNIFVAFHFVILENLFLRLQKVKNAPAGHRLGTPDIYTSKKK